MNNSEKVLALIKKRAKVDYPKIVVETYSLPYKIKFSKKDKRATIKAINKSKPD